APGSSAAGRVCPQLRGAGSGRRPRVQHGVGAQLAALPGALLLPALPALPPALRGHQAAEELRGQHGRDPPARAPVAAPRALGLPARAGGVSPRPRSAASRCAGGRSGPAWVGTPLLRTLAWGTPVPGRPGCESGRTERAVGRARAPALPAPLQPAALSPRGGNDTLQLIHSRRCPARPAGDLGIHRVGGAWGPAPCSTPSWPYSSALRRGRERHWPSGWRLGASGRRASFLPWIPTQPGSASQGGCRTGDRRGRG
ncbi:hypothetical protein H1C71_038421, partial [Ictidomys tridecemlineatus]